MWLDSFIEHVLKVHPSCNTVNLFSKSHFAYLVDTDSNIYSILKSDYILCLSYTHTHKHMHTRTHTYRQTLLNSPKSSLTFENQTTKHNRLDMTVSLGAWLVVWKIMDNPYEFWNMLYILFWKVSSISLTDPSHRKPSIFEIMFWCRFRLNISC